MRRDNIPPGYISPKEIQAAQRYYRIGRNVIVHTYKAQGGESMGIPARRTAGRSWRSINTLHWLGCRVACWIACYGRILYYRCGSGRERIRGEIPGNKKLEDRTYVREKEKAVDIREDMRHRLAIS